MVDLHEFTVTPSKVQLRSSSLHWLKVLILSADSHRIKSVLMFYVKINSTSALTELALKSKMERLIN